MVTGHAFGRAILDHDNQKDPVSFNGFPYSRYKSTSDIEWAAAIRKKSAKDEQMSLGLFEILPSVTAFCDCESNILHPFRSPAVYHYREQIFEKLNTTHQGETL